MKYADFKKLGDIVINFTEILQCAKCKGNHIHIKKVEISPTKGVCIIRYQCTCGCKAISQHDLYDILCEKDTDVFNFGLNIPNNKEVIQNV